MNKIVLLACFFILHLSYSQQVKLIDAETLKPIPNVIAFNSQKTKMNVSNEEGILIISSFDETEEITFQHLNYHVFTATKKQLIEEGGIVQLMPFSQQLEEIVLSASKWEQPKRHVSQKITAVTRPEILFTNPQTSADLLQHNAHVFVQKSQLGGGSPMMRGFSANRLLISVDGVRMNNAIFRSGNLQNVISIDPLAVKRVEVLFGPGSVMYGSDAVGGVMNFYTLDPIVSSSQKNTFSGSALTRYSTANQEKTANAGISFGAPHWGTYTSITYSDFDDMQMGKYGPEEYLRPEYVRRINGEDVMVINDHPRAQTPTGYSQVNLLQKITYRPSEVTQYLAGFYFSTTSDFARYDRLIRYRGNQLRSAEWEYGPQQWLMATLQVNLKNSNPLYQQFRITNAYQRFGESRQERNFQSSSRFSTQEVVHALSTTIDAEKKFGNKTTLFYGVEYVFNKVLSDGTETNVETHQIQPAASRYPNGATWQSAAAYANAELKTSPGLTLSGGLRYNYIYSNADFTENNTFYNFPFQKATVNTGALTGTWGVNWQPNEVLQWKAHFSTAFRAPNIDDIGKIFDSEPGSVVVPNPYLKPEYAYNGELDARLNFSKKVIVDVVVYYTYLANAMVRRPFRFNESTTILYNGELSDVQAIQNAANAKVHGFEASLYVRLNKNMSWNSQLTYSGGKEILDTGEEAPLRHAPPLFGSSHCTWENDRLKLDLFVNYSSEVSFWQLAPSEIEKPYIYARDHNGNPYSPAWYTLNLRTHYTFWKSLMLNIGLENITNQRYKTYSSGIAAPGINLVTGANYSF